MTSRFAHLPLAVWGDISVLTGLAVLGVIGFAPAFSDPVYLVAGFGGLLVGTLAGVAAAMLRLGMLASAGVAVGAYLLFGSALAMPQQAIGFVIPTLDTLGGLVAGAVFGWADIVTLTTPVGAPDYIAVLPYVVGWLVGLASATIAARWFATRGRGPLSSALALVAPTGVYVASVLIGTDEPYLAGVRGVVFAAVALVWMAWRPAPQSTSPSARSALRRRKLTGVATIAAVAITGGSLLGAATAPGGEDRFVLRDQVEPPFDPTEYPSPLSAFRHYTNELTDDVLLTVDGLEPGDRIRLATMDAFTGKLWTVTGSDLAPEGSGTFRLVSGRDLPAPQLADLARAVTIHVVVGEEYRGVWMPSVGYAREIDFDVPGAVRSTALRYNATTGVLVDSDGVPNGLAYALDAAVQDPEPDGIRDLAVAPLTLPIPEDVPDVISSRAIEWTAGFETPYEKLQAIAVAMSEGGYLSHGRDNDEPASAGHGADRMIDLLERTYMVGDGEQYAGAFALMARSLGYPARVVMGFAPEVGSSGTVEVTGDDVDAWVEVAFDDVGWVPFYPTPDETEVPKDEQPKPQSQPQPQVRQPPRADGDEDDLVSAVEIGDTDDDDRGFVIPAWVGTVAAIVLIPLGLYFVPLLLVGLAKGRRRRKRRQDEIPDRCAAGAWDELVDVYAELGYVAPRGTTRIELAQVFEQQFRDEVAARERERADAETRAANKAARAEAAAEEKRRRAAGIGGAKPTGSTAIAGLMDATVLRAREAATWRPGVTGADDPLPVLPGLRDLAVSTDVSVFSGREVGDAEIATLWAEADDAADAARRSVSWFRRRLSGFRYRLRRDVVATAASKLATSASDRIGTAAERVGEAARRARAATTRTTTEETG